MPLLLISISFSRSKEFSNLDVEFMFIFWLIIIKYLTVILENMSSRAGKSIYKPLRLSVAIDTIQFDPHDE